MADPDHDATAFRLVTYLLAIGAILYFVPYILGVQGNLIVGSNLSNVSAFLVTSSNPFWAVGLAYVSIALLAVMGAIAAAYTLITGGRPEPTTETVESGN